MLFFFFFNFLLFFFLSLLLTTFQVPLAGRVLRVLANVCMLADNKYSYSLLEKNQTVYGLSLKRGTWLQNLEGNISNVWQTIVEYINNYS